MATASVTLKKGYFIAFYKVTSGDPSSFFLLCSSQVWKNASSMREKEKENLMSVKERKPGLVFRSFWALRDTFRPYFT